MRRLPKYLKLARFRLRREDDYERNQRRFDTIQVSMKKVIGLLPITMLLLSIVASSNAFAYECGAEWVNEYHGYLTNLNNNDENAAGFYNELSNDASWDGKFILGDDGAWESDWKDPSHSGQDSWFADSTEFAFFSGHGNTSGFYFGTTRDDHQLHYNDALWGNTKMDWLAIDACEVLQQAV